MIPIAQVNQVGLPPGPLPGFSAIILVGLLVGLLAVLLNLRWLRVTGRPLFGGPVGLIAAGLLIVAGVLADGLGAIALELSRFPRPGLADPHPPGLDLRSYGQILLLVGIFLFLVEYILNVVMNLVKHRVKPRQAAQG
jgi:hypothetical protein